MVMSGSKNNNQTLIMRLLNYIYHWERVLGHAKSKEFKLTELQLKIELSKAEAARTEAEDGNSLINPIKEITKKNKIKSELFSHCLVLLSHLLCLYA